MMKVLYLIVQVTTLVFCVEANAQDSTWSKQCNSTFVKGNCNASVDYKKESGNYTVTADTTGCKSVDVQIDATVYPLKFLGLRTDDHVTVYDKDKVPAVSVISCKVYESFEEMDKRCKPVAESKIKAESDREVGAPQSKCRAMLDAGENEKWSACIRKTYPAWRKIIEKYVSELNSCAGWAAYYTAPAPDAPELLDVKKNF